MSIMTPYEVLRRIRGATIDSPIAVFYSASPGKVNAQFANTFLNKERASQGDANLIGIFHNEMDINTINVRLLAAKNNEVI